MSLKLCVQRRKLNAFAINAFRVPLPLLFIHGADAINYPSKGQGIDGVKPTLLTEQSFEYTNFPRTGKAKDMQDGKIFKN